ncbi:hypothetical protein [uncultured Psychrobacter sp.]|uniref:hypothetical protein n=1 Tax=uncultured Psychrobacter sp. TaxID=259303 RepID=UPI0030DC3BF5
MEAPINPTITIAVTLFMMIVVIPAGFALWKKWQMKMSAKQKEVWDLLRAEKALNKDENNNETHEVFLRHIIKGHITQAGSSKVRLVGWCVFLLLWVCFLVLYVYSSLDFSTKPPTFLDSFDPLVLGLCIFAILGGGLSALYEKSKLHDVNIFLDSFAEAHGIEGKVTKEKLASIEKLNLSK